MRTPTDAIRSLKKYVSEILSPQPVLAELVSSDDVHWTVFRRVNGAFDVDKPTWEFLRSRDRHAPVVVGSPADPEVYYLRSLLTEDSAALAAAVGSGDLALASAPVVGWALPLQPDWEVRIAYDYAEIPGDRPFAQVGLVGSAGTSGHAFAYEVSQPMAIECVLPRVESASEATTNAMGVAAALLRGFRGVGVGLGRPIRVPLYDYEGVASDEVATQRHPSDFMRLVDLSVRLLPDPNDPRLVPVVADLRVTWRVANDLTELGFQGTRWTDEVKVTIEGS